MPAAETVLEVGLVRTLLREQHPDLAHLPLRPAATGWDNVTFRLGDDLAVRLPRRAAAAALVESEQRWLPELAGRLPLPVPVPVRRGVPGMGYPWPWSVVPWFGGTSADVAGVVATEAATLGRFLAALHTAAPPDAPLNPYRSVPLIERSVSLLHRVRRLVDAGGVDGDVVLARWNAAAAEPVDCAPTWIHGDLHPRNVLVADGRLAAVLDWGDLAAGDPATDLAAAWMLFPAAAQEGLRSGYGSITPGTWARARGWALFFGIVLLDTGLSDGDDHVARWGRSILQRALTDDPIGP